jgi:transcriptional regulator with XRE-family HTH domain
MREQDTFGALLRAYRTQLGGSRRNIEWLAGKLAYSTSTVYGWENNDSSKGLPSRVTVLNIARLYGLSHEEANRLILACRAQRKRPAHAARYTPLTPNEISSWMPMQGPTLPMLNVLRDMLRASQEAYIDGELRSARSLAESVLTHIAASEIEAISYDNWNRDDRDELSRQWLLAWHSYFESSALLETTDTSEQVCVTYLERARHMAKATNDSRLIALSLHIEGDYHHLLSQHTEAMALHLQALEQLGGFDADPSLAAMIQRLIILDGAHLLPREQLVRHLYTGRRMADRLAADEYCARVLLNEAIGRVLGMAGDRDCWSVLAEAEREARQTFPVGYVTSLYSRMVALTATSSSQTTDRDQLTAVGTYAFAAATHNGWQRRVDQITQIAARGRVELHAFP